MSASGSATPRLAVVLYGRIGGLDHGDGAKYRSRDGGQANAPMLVMAYAAFARHVLLPSKKRGDVFIIQFFTKFLVK